MDYTYLHAQLIGQELKHHEDRTVIPHMGMQDDVTDHGNGRRGNFQPRQVR